MGSSGRQGVLIGFWIVAITATATLLWHQDEFLAVSGVPVAQIVRIEKDVNYRGENDIRWKHLRDGKQSIYDGDKLATGTQSSAMIDFGDGRAAMIGAETTMGLSSIKQASGMTYIIALSKGSVAIQKVKATNPAIKTQFPIIVRSDGRDYLIEPGDERGVYRDDSGVKEFVGRRQPKFPKIKPTEQTVAPKVDVPIAVVASLINESPIKISEQIVAVPAQEELPPKELPPPNLGSTEPKGKDAKKAITKKAAHTAIPAATPLPKPVAPAVSQAKPELSLVNNFAVSGIDLDLSGLSREYYSFQSLNSLKGELGGLRWKEQPSARGMINGAQVEPAIELKTGDNRKEMLLPRGGTLTLKLEDFGDLRPSTDRDGIPCAVLSMRDGSKVTRGAERPAWIFNGEAREIYVCSYRDALENLPLVIGVGSLEGDRAAPRPRIFSKPLTANLRFQMVITTASQLSLLFPIISKNESFRIVSTPGMASQGVFIARSGKVVMQLAGSGFNARAADALRDKVGGDMVFKGARSALMDAQGMTTEQLKEMVARGDAQGRKIYLHKSGSLLPVSRSFLEERKEVANFVKSVASQLFTEKVDVIAYK